MPPEFNIERPKQVIVEGVDDVRVMGALCEHLGICRHADLLHAVDTTA